MADLVVGITGASGAAYGVRLLEVLMSAGQTVHVVISKAGWQVLNQELKIKPTPNDIQLRHLMPTDPDVVSAYAGWSADTLKELPGTLIGHGHGTYMAPIASGSFVTDGMVIAPCSMDTLSSLSAGLCGNLIHRAAGVHLKERRKLVLVPRETPLSTRHLEAMATLSRDGAVILPAMPGFYHEPASLMDAVDFIVGRICDQLGVENRLIQRWGS